MSNHPTVGAVDLIESATTPLAPVGVSRLARQGGVPVISTDGGAFAPVNQPSAGAISTAMIADGAVTIAKLAVPTPGAWQLVAALGAATQDWDIATGLTGDTDGGYEIDFDIGSASGKGQITLSLQPNAVATNQAGTGWYNNGTTVAPNTQTTITMGLAGETTARCRGRIEMSSKTGAIRVFRCKSFARTGTGQASMQGVDLLVEWSDTSTVITSLRIHSSVAASIDTSSVVRWRALNRGW